MPLHDGPGHSTGDAAYCGGCLIEQERRSSGGLRITPDPIDALTPEQAVIVADAVPWDDRKALADIFQDKGGYAEHIPHEALIAVARYGATMAVRLMEDSR